jgi:hypothetical protein
VRGPEDVVGLPERCLVRSLSVARTSHKRGDGSRGRDRASTTCHYIDQLPGRQHVGDYSMRVLVVDRDTFNEITYSVHSAGQLTSRR